MGFYVYFYFFKAYLGTLYFCGVLLWQQCLMKAIRASYLVQNVCDEFVGLMCDSETSILVQATCVLSLTARVLQTTRRLNHHI